MLSDKDLSAWEESARQYENSGSLGFINAAQIRGFVTEVRTLRTAHAALLGVVRDAVGTIRASSNLSNGEHVVFWGVRHGLAKYPRSQAGSVLGNQIEDCATAVRALADAAAAEPRDEEGT